MTGAGSNPITRRRRQGFYLLLFGLLLWLASMIAIDVYIARSVGYGSGIADGGRVPPAVVADAKVGAKAADVVRATSENVGLVGAGETLWRILVSVAVLAGIVLFWFVIVSRIGVF